MERADPDDDFALLEAHLDGALTPTEAESLGRRLSADPRLGAELQRLRAERATRQAVWASYEPAGEEAANLANSTVSAAAQAERFGRTVLVARRAAALAAMVVIAFAGGWLARGVVPAGSHPAIFRVALTDEHGNIIAVQKFDDERAAREFAEDVGRWQSRPRRRSAEAETFTPVSGEF